MLTWIKKRVRMYEAFDFANEENPTDRKEYISAAVEDWQWWNALNI